MNSVWHPSTILFNFWLYHTHLRFVTIALSKKYKHHHKFRRISAESMTTIRTLIMKVENFDHKSNTLWSETSSMLRTNQHQNISVMQQILLLCCFSSHTENDLQTYRDTFRRPSNSRFLLTRDLNNNPSWCDRWSTLSGASQKKRPQERLLFESNVHIWKFSQGAKRSQNLLLSAHCPELDILKLCFQNLSSQLQIWLAEFRNQILPILGVVRFDSNCDAKQSSCCKNDSGPLFVSLFTLAIELSQSSPYWFIKQKSLNNDCMSLSRTRFQLMQVAGKLV